MPNLARSSRRVHVSPHLLLALAALLWSSNFIFGRAIRAEIPPVTLAFWRWVLAAILIAPFAWRHLVHDLSKLRRSWPTMLLLAFLGVTAFDALNYTALQSTPAINALLMQSAIPLLIIGFSFVLFSERIRPRQMLGLTLSLAGALTLITQGRLELLFAVGTNAGTVLAFVAVLFYSAYLSLLGHRPALHPLSFLFALVTLGTLMLFPFYLYEAATGSPLRPSLPLFLSLAYLALFPSILAYLCYIRAVGEVGANRAGVYIHLMPLFGSILAVLFLGESVRSFHVAGLALILSGVALAGIYPQESRAGPGQP